MLKEWIRSLKAMCGCEGTSSCGLSIAGDEWSASSAQSHAKLVVYHRTVTWEAAGVSSAQLHAKLVVDHRTVTWEAGGVSSHSYMRSWWFIIAQLHAKLVWCIIAQSHAKLEYHHSCYHVMIRHNLLPSGYQCLSPEIKRPGCKAGH
jgi:hypothetical protein